MNTRTLRSLVMLLWLQQLPLTSQSITIEECWQRAEANYPAIARYGIIEKTRQFDIANAGKAYLPQGTISAQASWQSEVTRIDLDFPEGLPPLDIPQIDRDQQRLVAELNQLIWDGGKIRAQKKSLEANAALEKQQLVSEIYSLRERVNNLYFGILLMKEHLQQQEILENELQRNYDNVEAYIRNGVANEADLSAVKVELLKTGQQRIQLESTLDIYIRMLSIMMDVSLHKEITFVKPTPEIENISPVINRPELMMFNAQETAVESQRSLLNAKNRPVMAAFAQGGYGKPGLNMFYNDFTPYFLGGIRLTWNFGQLYTRRNDVKKIELRKEAVSTQKETFLYNLSLQIPQHQMEIEKFRRTMQDDEEIIRHQRVIRKAAEVKVENGTMTVSDLMREINAEEAAKQAKTVHEIEYLLAIYALKYVTNQ